MYGRVTSKKHKTWDSDGLLEVTGKNAILMVISITVVNFITQKDTCFNIFDNRIYFMVGFGWQSYRKKNNQLK